MGKSPDMIFNTLQTNQMHKQLVIHEFVIPHERNIKSHCQICSEEFGITRREHVCKRCMRSVCDDCSPYKIKSYAADFKNRPRRMCRSCYIESETLQKYIKSNHLRMGEDSDLVRMWLKQLGLKAAPKKRTSERRKTKQCCKFREIWKSLNFSFREFIGKVLDESQISEDEVTELITLAMSELSGNKLVDCQHSIYILLYFLAHSSAANAVYFTNIIIQLVYSEQTSIDNIAYFMEQMNCTEIQIYKMENIIQQTYERMVRRCTINVFTAQMTIQIMSHLIAKRDFEELEKGIAYVFCQRKEFICQNANKPQEIYLDIIRNLSIAGYRQYVKDVDTSGNSSSGSKSSCSRSIRSGRASQKSVLSSQSSKDQSPDRKIENQNKKLRLKVKEQQQQIQALNQEIIELKASRDLGGTLSLKNGKKNSKMSENQEKRQQNDYSMLMSYHQEDYEKLDPCSTEDEATFNEIVQKKNQEIAALKKEINQLKEVIDEAEDQKRIREYQKEEQVSNIGGSQLGQLAQSSREDQISELRKENESLRNMNKKLLLKMQELSVLLMDKEQKKLAEANGEIQSLVHKLENGQSDFKKEQCRIF